LIAYKMGEKEYFFGDKPCAIDALLLPYLALLLKVRLSYNRNIYAITYFTVVIDVCSILSLAQVDLKLPVLQNYIKNCGNLQRYVIKGFLKHFPDSKFQVLFLV